MPVSASTQIVGVKETLRELAKVDRVAANELKRNARNIMKPIVTNAQSKIPNVALSGMSRKWVSSKSGVQLLPWEGDTARKYVKAKTTTKKPKEYDGIVRDLAAFYVSWAGGVNMLFDMAGRKNSSPMAANLTGKFGPPSRVMWQAAEEEAPQVEQNMEEIIDQLVKLTNQRLSRGSL
jgi:hypothetical protein